MRLAIIPTVPDAASDPDDEGNVLRADDRAEGRGGRCERQREIGRGDDPRHPASSTRVEQIHRADK